MAVAQMRVGPGTDPKDVRARWREASRQGPVAIDADTGATYALGYDIAKSLLTDRRLVGGGRAMFEMQNIPPGPLPDWYGSIMFSNEGPSHHRMRRLVQKAFTPRAIEGLREVAAALVAERMAPIREGGSGDLMEAFSDVPMRVMCALLGVAPSDTKPLIAWVNALGPIFGLMTPEQIAAASEAITEILDFSMNLRDEREGKPADDLMTEFIAAEEDGDRLTREETAALVANLLIGGHDTTVSQIGCTLLTLLTHPEAMKLDFSDDALLASTVSEAFRFETGVPLTWREVVQPLELEGVPCPEGSVVFVNFMTANRDPGIWQEPETFRPGRFLDSATPRLVAFGGGAHHCLGNWLAQMTIGEAVRGVSALQPELTVNPGDIRWDQVLGQNPASLPIAVNPHS